MGHSIGDGIIVLALSALLGSWFYFKSLDRRRRLELIHQERLVAIEKGIPLPELPIDPVTTAKPPDPKAPLLHGIVWTALGLGAVAALIVMDRFRPNPSPTIWPLPLPLLFLGTGLILYYFLVTDRRR